MAFFPDLIGWPTEDQWQKAAQYFYSRAVDDGSAMPAWYGAYFHNHFGGSGDDTMDVYCYRQEEDIDESVKPEVVVHLHMSGPCVWELTPLYDSPSNLPHPLDHSLAVLLNGDGQETILPVEVVTRHVLSPMAQTQPFLAQMCFLASSTAIYRDLEEYRKGVEVDGVIPLLPGQVFSPAFLMSHLEDIETEDEILLSSTESIASGGEEQETIQADEKLIIIAAHVIGSEEIAIHGEPFLLRISLTTPYGCLTLCSNRNMITDQILPGDICYATGVLSADVAIEENAGGFGN